eukprot:1393097-Amorphochlora_amoeboformis.AAC.1
MTTHEWKDQLPKEVTGQKLRALSKTHLRSAKLAVNKSEGKNLCHKVPNSILTTAYNNTNDKRIKCDIVQFNYSTDNVFSSKKNTEHTEMEKRLRSDKYTQRDLNRKGGSILVAMEKMHCKYTVKTTAHVMKTIVNSGSGYCSVVASADMRIFNSSAVQTVIESARSWRDLIEQLEKLQGGTRVGRERDLELLLSVTALQLKY